MGVIVAVELSAEIPVTIASEPPMKTRVVPRNRSPPPNVIVVATPIGGAVLATVVSATASAVVVSELLLIAVVSGSVLPDRRPTFVTVAGPVIPGPTRNVRVDESAARVGLEVAPVAKEIAEVGVKNVFAPA